LLGRHLERCGLSDHGLFDILVRELIDAEHGHVLKDHVRRHALSAAGVAELARKHHVHAIARQDEAGDARHVIDPHGESAHPGRHLT
jgi:hypothetical protein